MTILHVDINSESDFIEYLRSLDDLYYNGSDSVVTDEQYDLMKEYAQTHWPENPYFNEIGSSVKNFKVKHDFILGSLKKFKPDTIDKFLSKFDNETSFVIMPKLDGSSIYARYENGKLVKATTRGDGQFGFDITDKAKLFLPKTIKEKSLVSLRGECLLTNDVSIRLGFSNPRNGVSGLLNQDGNKNCKNINVLFYEWIDSPNKFRTEDFITLSENGIPVCEYRLLSKSDITVQGLKDLLFEMKEEYVYELDGLVICPIDYKRENVSHPEMKIAFKVNAAGVDTIIDEIEWNVSRTGRIVPLAKFLNPIEIAGTQVQKATCHNAKYVIENQLGKNSKVKILKSGDIIPQIVEVITKSEHFDLPEGCPSCSNPLFIKGVDLICDNENCKEKNIYFLEYFFKTLGCENISAQTFRNLDLQSLEDVLNISYDYIISLDGFGDKSAEMIKTEIDNCLQNIKPELLLAAMAIPNMGIKNCKKFIESLNNDFSSKEKFEYIFKVTRDEFTSISGFGESIYKSVVDSLERIKKLYKTCSESRRQNQFSFEESTTNNEDKIYVKVTITGKGPYPRKELEKILLDKGFASIGFSSETEMLICDDLNSNSSKMTKAKKAGIKILTYEDFFNEYK